MNIIHITNIKRYVTFLFLSFCALGLTGCIDMHEPTSFHQSRLTVQEQNYTKMFDTETVDDREIYQVAADYDRYGIGPVQVSVTYNPDSDSNNSIRAIGELGRIKGLLREQGVKSVTGDILPITDKSTVSKTVVSYVSMTAQAPDCKQIPGLEDRVPDTAKDYELGCSTETLMAKQIYRPRDLLGNAGAGRADARRASNIVDGYRTGESADSLNAETVSEN